MAVKLISAIVHETPETTVSLPPKPHTPAREARMCDDAFARVCDLVNDVSMPVRALAAGLLGDFHSVNPQLLEQTLDKKLMSHLKVYKHNLRTKNWGYIIIIDHKFRNFKKTSQSSAMSPPNQGVKSDHERQKEKHAAGGGASGFDSGRTWGSSVPKVTVVVRWNPFNYGTE